jgi:hypothetical protein
MDYIFTAAIRNTQLLIVLISYDIACQWFINLWMCIQNYWPRELQPPSDLILRLHIPKLHEPAHQRKDHAPYSFNFSPGVSLTDGECPERIWSVHNGLGNATKTQGPGSRHDVLDDHFGFWNWSKYISLGLCFLCLMTTIANTSRASGTTLIRKYKAAVRDRNLQVESHRGFSATIAESTVAKWEVLCTAWEVNPHDKSVQSPYAIEENCKS